ncbi:cytochrome bd oxidase small subunit CydS [Bacillus sp. 28A-2]
MNMVTATEFFIFIAPILILILAIAAVFILAAKQ